MLLRQKPQFVTKLEPLNKCLKTLIFPQNILKQNWKVSFLKKRFSYTWWRAWILPPLLISILLMKTDILCDKEGVQCKWSHKHRIDKNRFSKTRVRVVSFLTLLFLLARLILSIPIPWRTNFTDVNRLSTTAGCRRKNNEQCLSFNWRHAPSLWRNHFLHISPVPWNWGALAWRSHDCKLFWSVWSGCFCRFLLLLIQTRERTLKLVIWDLSKIRTEWYPHHCGSTYQAWGFSPHSSQSGHAHKGLALF